MKLWFVFAISLLLSITVTVSQNYNGDNKPEDVESNLRIKPAKITQTVQKKNNRHISKKNEQPKATKRKPIKSPKKIPNTKRDSKNTNTARNKGSENDNKDPPVIDDKKDDKPPKNRIDNSKSQHNSESPGTEEQGGLPSPLGGFNLDGILDLMAGDENGSVNFAAIGIELANNIAQMIDMNEFGSMATTFGMMMSGLGASALAASQNQNRAGQNDGQSPQRQTPNLNNGIAAIVGQIINNGQLSSNAQQNIASIINGAVQQRGPLVQRDVKDSEDEVNYRPHSYNDNAGFVLEGGGISEIVSGVLGSGDIGSISNTIGKFTNNENPVNLFDAIDGLLNGNDTADLTGIANAFGIRNLALPSHEKTLPDGCPSCFNCMYPGSVCGHNSTCNEYTGRCDCPSGWTGEDCLSPACASPVDEGRRPSAKKGHCHQDTECRPGWGSWNCNMCLNDSACDPLIATNDGGRCYNGSKLITTVNGICTIANQGLSEYLPEGIAPKMTFACNKDNNTCDAQFWVTGSESFYCDLEQCDVTQWGSQQTAQIKCKTMRCKCIPGRFFCGHFGLDISSVLESVEGPVDIKCKDDGFSRCSIRESRISKVLSDLFGEDSIKTICKSGQCVHYSQLPDYQKPSNSTSKSSMLFGVGTSFLSIYLVLYIIKALVKRQGVNPIDRLGPEECAEDDDDSYFDVDPEKIDLLDPKYENMSEISRIMRNTKRKTVYFRDISYTIPIQGLDFLALRESSPTQPIRNTDPHQEEAITSDGKQNKDIKVLESVSGIVKPGEILAILGASGAGKSTLLDILARRDKCGVVKGQIQINNKDIISGITTEEFHRMSGYVDQQDLHVATATVYETVMTSALLRLPRTMSVAGRERRVRSVLEELGLWSVRDSRIGKSGARGISGGEMRRVSIACELVTSPSIIFLDEPTSGLDAYNAYMVMETLSQLARRYGRTIICTIHQPRTDIFKMFDRLIVLAAGKMCYSGLARNMSSYLDSIGHRVPAGYNIADFSIDLVQQATVDDLSDSLKQKCSDSADKHKSKNTDRPAKNTETPDSSAKGKGVSDTLPSKESKKKGGASTKHSTDGIIDSQESQFFIHDIDVSLNQLVESFSTSSQFKELDAEIEKHLGTDRARSSFSEIRTFGGTPYTRPVTPIQQAVVIFINLSDLAQLLIRRLKGEQISETFDDKDRPSVFEQFKVLSARIFRHLYRDPTLMLANYMLSVFIGLMCGILFYQLDNSIQGVQNRLGLLMFILAFYGFGCMTSLLVFSEERLLYLRERANAYYNPVAYFAAKVTFDLIPLRVVPPLLFTLIAYPMAGLAATWNQFLSFFATLTLFNLTVASQMFFIGLLAEELVVSNFLASLLMLFSLLFGGLILNKQSMPMILKPMCRVSSFNLAYEALAINELKRAQIEEVRFGLQIQIPSASLISSFGFNLMYFWSDIFIMCGVLVGCLGLSLLWLTYVIKERR